MIRDGAGFISLAYHGKTKPAIAAAVFLRFGRSAVYKFGASDENDWHLRPNNLVMWEGIKHLAESGAQHLHFGRTSPGQDGLRRFKLSWGSAEESIQYTRYDVDRDRWKPVVSSTPNAHGLASKLGHHLFERSPLAVNRFAGRLFYPHLD